MAIFNLRICRYNNLLINITAALVITLPLLPASSIAGDMYYSKGFTKSQRENVEKCYDVDTTFPAQVASLTSNADILLHGMFAKKHGYIILLYTNKYGKWLEFTPLQCDLRSPEQIAADDAAERKRAEERKAQAEIKAKKDAEIARKKREREMTKAKAEAKRKAAEKKEREELAAKQIVDQELFSALLAKCVKQDSVIVVEREIPEIHRRGVIHKAVPKRIETWSKTETHIKVTYSYDLWKNGVYTGRDRTRTSCLKSGL
tara:strand:+ start:189 stop:968 length:780 start_codon:yes stop_codon:yes gene_type:complete